MKKLHYSWVMVYLSSFLLAMVALRISTFGVFLLPLTDEFKWERGSLSIAITIATIAGAVLAIFIGKLSDKYGPRLFVTIYAVMTSVGFLLMTQVRELWHVYAIWGVLMGSASASAYLPLMSTIPRWFKTKMTTAIGITITGFSIGSVVWPPVTQLLIDWLDWRWTFVVMSIVNAVLIIPLAQLLKNKPEDLGLLPYGETAVVDEKKKTAPSVVGLTLRQTVRTSGFWLTGLIFFCFYAVLNVVFIHIIAHAQDIKIQPIIAASTISIISGISVFPRLTIGFISDKIGSLKALVIGLAVATVALVFLVVSPSAWAFYAFTVIFGLAYGATVPLETAVPAMLFGTRSLGSIMSIMGLVSTVGFAASPPIAGAIFDATQKYQTAFITCLILMIIGLALSAVMLRWKSKLKSYRNIPHDV
ncbi:MAG: MFS transporter [Dehalococcoidales bacterium]|nr:MFS transporter [Dehalococcoidales bacterium]